MMGKSLNYIIATLQVVLLLLLVSCGAHPKSASRIVSVTILPQQYIAEQIAGERFEVHCVVPQNSNPEAYDPTPEQLMKVEQSEAYMRVGMLGFEMAWMERFERNNPHMKVYDTSRGIDMIAGSHSHTHDNGVVHTTHIADPHIWCSPRNVGVMAQNIYQAFAELDPEGESFYKANYEALMQRVVHVDSLITQILKPHRGATFAIYHPSLTYLARDYGLQQLCIEYEGRENSVLSMKSIVDQARDAHVEVVFVQKEFNARQVETFAQEIDAEVVTINPLSYDWEREMIEIAHAIARE